MSSRKSADIIHEMVELFYEYSKRWQHTLEKRAFAGGPRLALIG